MSRSNPTENAPNPAVRWFEWTGEKGVVRYYDKTKEQNVEVELPFTFLLLDQLATVKGWHESSQSGIYSNEVRDTRADVMVVKAFKGGTIAEGLYKDIKDRVNVAGGRFNANCYIAFKGDDGDLTLGSLRFKGAALGAWMEFTKTHRADLYKKAIEIHGVSEGKKGRVIFKTPVFRMKDVSETTQNISVALDADLQTFLAAYLARTKRDQVSQVPHDAGMTEDEQSAIEGAPSDFDIAPNDDDIPF
jgi:hypothetical protein